MIGLAVALFVFWLPSTPCMQNFPIQDGPEKNRRRISRLPAKPWPRIDVGFAEANGGILFLLIQDSDNAASFFANESRR